MADGVTAAPLRLTHADEILAPDALGFVGELHRRFAESRDERVSRRATRRVAIARAGRVSFRPDTAEVRDSEWTVSRPPADLLDRRVEISTAALGPAMIAAMNSGARVWSADLGAGTPLWSALVRSQLNLRDAVLGTVSVTHPDGQVDRLRLDAEPPAIMVRPRDWSALERNLTVDGEPAAAALVDLGLFAFHNAAALLARGSAPYFCLPVDGYLEARLWADILRVAEEQLGLPRNSLRAAAAVETLPAAVEMDEILYELRDRSLGLVASVDGYLFSYIDCLREFPVPPNPAEAPFVRAYTDQLVRTSHRRGTHAVTSGADFGSAAQAGFDGARVTHPESVAVCAEAFDRLLGERPNQISRLRYEVLPDSAALTELDEFDEVVTTDAVRDALDELTRHLTAWLAAEPIEVSATTAELARAQVWQWVQVGARLQGPGEPITAEDVRVLLDEQAFEHDQYELARMLVEQLCLQPAFPSSIAQAAYDLID